MHLGNCMIICMKVLHNASDIVLFISRQDILVM